MDLSLGCPTISLLRSSGALGLAHLAHPIALVALCLLGWSVVVKRLVPVAQLDLLARQVPQEPLAHLRQVNGGSAEGGCKSSKITALAYNIFRGTRA